MTKAKKPTISDQRTKLPRHATKRWGRRTPEDIIGLVIHQSAGSRAWSTKSIAEYHVGPNHISPTGCPGLCYVFTVEADGKIIQANDLEDITWSQGSQITPLPGTKSNTNYLGICVLGDFDGPSYDGKDDQPTKEQLASLDQLVSWLQDKLGLNRANLFGHYHFGKANCPGTFLADWLEERREGAEWYPVEIADWQLALVALGYDLGAYGPDKDGVDGQWGGKSKMALLQFQKDNELPQSGMRDRLTAVALADAYLTARPLVAADPVPASPDDAVQE